MHEASFGMLPRPSCEHIKGFAIRAIEQQFLARAFKNSHNDTVTFVVVSMGVKKGVTPDVSAEFTRLS
mgnify:CR=1 FL=1